MSTTTTPTPNLPESVVTDEMVTRARELFAAELERDGIEFLPGEIRKPNSMLTMFEDRAIRAIVAALTEVRAANARAEGWLPIESAPTDGTPIIGCAMQAPKFTPEHVGRYWATDYKQKFWTDGEWRVRLTHYIAMPPTDAAQAVRSESSEGEGNGN